MVKFENLRVALDSGRRVTASFDLSNQSAETWRVADGFALGYQIFDPETDTLVIDGTRLAPAHDVAPGGQAHFEVVLALPHEPGRYRVFLSMMREHVAWFWEKGWPFLLTDAWVDDESQGRLGKTRIATTRLLKVERVIRALRLAVTLPFETIFNNRSLIQSMTRRDILGRYRGSFGGATWTVLNPLLLMLTYFFIFGVVLQQKFNANDSPLDYVFYFLAGMLPWLAFSEAVGRAPTILIEYRNFIKKLRFPVETLPLNIVAAGMVTECFGLVIFAAGLILVRGGLPFTVAWLPLLVIPQILFTAGITWFLAALGLFVRDLGQVIGYVVTLWFFLTPICYSEAKLKETAPILTHNPIYLLVRAYRSVLLEGHGPDRHAVVVLWCTAIVVFLLGHAWFYKLRKWFADVI
ncbi:MAG TPA: ABC transporter permease [Bryobacteraceae bacterium]|jgi:lipopolysaccharide transport system permease protein